MHIALTGASGFIGSVTARQLTAAGHTVTALVRETSRRDHIEPYVDRFVAGDHADESRWGALLEGADCIVHNSVDWTPLRGDVDLDGHLRSNLDASIKLLHAAGPRQFIFVSTIAVHHDMSPRWEGRIDEDHPLRPSMLYGAYKAAVEAHLWSAHYTTGQHTCAIRPCGVYGIDPTIERSHGFRLIEKIRAGERPSKAGGGKFVHVEDVAASIVAAVGHEGAAGKPFNLVDCYARWSDWDEIACELMGMDIEIVHTAPAAPKNDFVKDQAKSLGAPAPFLDRGHDGIREHLAELIEKTG